MDETGLQGGGEWAALCGGGEAQLGHQLGLRVQVEAVAEAVQQGGCLLHTSPGGGHERASHHEISYCVESAGLL